MLGHNLTKSQFCSVPQSPVEYVLCLTHLEQNSRIPFRFVPLFFLVKTYRVA